MTKKKVYPLLSIKKTVPKEDGNDYQQGIAQEDAVVYKKALARGKSGKWISVIVKLGIKAGTRVFLSNTKCRAAEAKVLSIKMLGRSKEISQANSMHDARFYYVVGKVLRPVRPFSPKFLRCESGIHFFRTLAEARDY
jgi:hypothetical protein